MTTAFVALLASTSFAQSASSTAQCVLAGRVDELQRWAPKFKGVELLGARGQRISSASAEALAQVKSVRLNQPALLSDCNGNQAIPEGAATSSKKEPVPALSASANLLRVLAINKSPLRVGGHWIELQLDATPQRVIMLKR